MKRKALDRKRQIELPLQIRRELDTSKVKVDDRKRSSNASDASKKKDWRKLNQQEDNDHYGKLLRIKDKLPKEFMDDGLADLLDFKSEREPKRNKIMSRKAKDSKDIKEKYLKEKNEKTNLNEINLTESKPKNITHKYVPPQARVQETTDLELKRRVKGLLNRLSDGNMESIVKEIMGLYREKARRDVTGMVVKGLMEIISDSASLNDSYITTLAGFSCLLYTSVGIDFGSVLVEDSVKKISSPDGSSDEGQVVQNKTRSNITSLLSYLYSFNMVSCGLIYDLIKKCLEKLEEIDVEILLRILKICGTQIRGDDPTALKEIILMMNQEIAKKDSPRLKFMSESIMDLKNNRMRKKQDQNDQLVRLKKFIMNYNSKNSISNVEPLRIGINDIMTINEKGRWWLVGSAWAGTDNSSSAEQSLVLSENQHLLALAKAQKMNTDVRKTVFVIVMSSEDFIDAYEKLQKLGLKDKQEREIVRVIMHCCLQERIYNPYYAYLAQRFCDYGYSFKITLQYALWDIFKSVDEDDGSFQGIEGVRKMSNLGRFFLHLVIHKSIPISILKSLTFTSLAKLNALFCQVVVGGVLCHNSSKSQKLVKDIFMRMKDTSTEAKEGLLFFIKQYISTEKLETVLKPIPKTNILLLSSHLPAARTILEGGRVV